MRLPRKLGICLILNAKASHLFISGICASRSTNWKRRPGGGGPSKRREPLFAVGSRNSGRIHQCFSIASNILRLAKLSSTTRTERSRSRLDFIGRDSVTAVEPSRQAHGGKPDALPVLIILLHPDFAAHHLYQP